jgi:transcription antitermination protein NusB
VKIKASARKKARAKTLEALYQIFMAGHDVLDVEIQYVADLNPKKVDIPYFQVLLNGIVKDQKKLDALLTPFLDRPIKDLTPIELCVLRLAAYELDSQCDVPYKVVINEALELTKKFGATDAFKFVNGVLDKLARQVRRLEISS